MAVKTNAMRILDRLKIYYKVHEYPHGDEAVDGMKVAELLGQDVHTVYKTLVTRGASAPSRAYYVFVIPVCAELDLKACARAVGEKSVEMIHVREINAVTGYIRGGCSPVGMKKQYITVFHEQMLILDTVMVSGGKIGLQIELSPADLIKTTSGITADIITR
ncbi:MAG: Cys-tRNA(Pro) deacylase [Oscillospiraceae bacterium]|nr:Cys-tRNA(Pro) deacylase [Oscillospiraceae bacterium]